MSNFDAPDTIEWRGNTYRKVYDHEGGGTYYSCIDSELDWLDIYPDGEVRGLGNGKSYHIGKWDDSTIITSADTLANEYPWWNDLYDDISIKELSWDTGMTEEEIQDSLDEIATSWPDYKFETFAKYNGTDDPGDYETVAIYSDPSGAEFLATIDGDVLLDVTPDVAVVLGFADEVDDIGPMKDDDYE